MFVEATSMLKSKSPSQRSYDSEAYFLSQAYQHKVRYFPLSDNFYVFSGNTIPQERLEQLAIFSKSLDEPELFGIFANDAAYLKTLDLLLRSGLETEHRYEFFERVIDPIVENHDKVLDVGIGTGELTKLFGKRFNEITVIDPSAEALDALKADDFGTNKELKKIHNSTLDVELPKNYFNAVVISHTLYYLDNKLWFSAIKKLYESLKPGGVVAVVLNGGLGKSALINAFGGKNLALHNLVMECVKSFNTTIEFFATREVYYSLGINPMLHIAGLHLYDAETTASRPELTSYLESNNRLEADIYHLDIYQKFMLIYKQHN